MAILICRVAWMPTYQSNDEPAVGGGSYVRAGNVPHESLNFLPVGKTYYGFVHNKGRNIGLQELGGKSEDETVTGVLVVFCAEEPKSSEYLVTGWYVDATVYRQPIARPADDLKRTVYFTARKAKLVPVPRRCFRIPGANDNPRSGIGGIGSAYIWYGLNKDRARAFRESLGAYIERPDLTLTRREVVESRQRRRSERLERRGSYRRFIARKGYRCEACEWSITKDEQEVWGTSFELHHLAPLHELEEDETRVVRIDDFAVLCASCHRAIHRTEYVSDVAGFAAAHLCG